MFLSYLLAVLAAATNAASNVLQRKANREVPADLSMSPKLMLQLLRRKVWLAGIVTVTLSFVLMAAALAMGRLAAVQPIVAFELPLTLIAAAKTFGARLAWPEWVAVAAMTVGLAGLIAFLSPQAGNNGRASGLAWAIGASATIAVIVLLIAIGRTRQGHGRAALLGVAAGVTFGLTAAFMKGMTVSFHHGPLGVLSTWQTYAVVVAGVLGMFLMQNALHAGRLIAAQPGITLADPAVAIAWGVAVFNEKAQGGLFLIWAVLSATVMAGGAIFLARSPVLEDSTAGRDEGHATSPGRYLGERSPTTAATPPRK